jgi:predicted nucleic acid-binding protein
VYLIDTNVVSEARKKRNADAGVLAFFREVAAEATAVYLSAVTVGELRRGVELIRHRGNARQARRLETWLSTLLEQYKEQVLPFDADAAQIWGRLRVPHPEHERDKQIVATALLYGLTVVTRNTADFAGTGVALRNPFTQRAG